jgi:hypothetical protein
MNRRTVAGGLLVILTWALPSSADAQQPLPRYAPGTPGPTLSPYLNLLRSGSSATANYYGLVRPQFQTLAGYQSLQQQVGRLQGPGEQVTAGAEEVAITGRGASFLNHGSYFMTTNVATNPFRAGATTTRPSAQNSGPTSMQPTQRSSSRGR